MNAQLAIQTPVDVFNRTPMHVGVHGFLAIASPYSLNMYNISDYGYMKLHMIRSVTDSNTYDTFNRSRIAQKF